MRGIAILCVALGVASIAPTAKAQAVTPRSRVPGDMAPPGPTPEPKVTNGETKAKAGKYITYGDANFAKQKYLAAYSRYKTAAEIANDMAEPPFRQGFALVALGQFESAVKAFRRGLAIRSDWSDSTWRLKELYGDDQLAKTAHLENLAKAIEANPYNSDLLVVLGIELYFDGQQQRSVLFFARAAQLGGNDDRLLGSFLPKPGPADAKKNRPPGKIVF